MATFIRVSDDESRLLRRNREQVDANRLQKVEDDERAAVGRDIQATTTQQQINGRRQQLARRIEPAASFPSSFNLVVVELQWQNGRDYDLNIGRDNEFVGWFFSEKPGSAVNDGTLWNQLFWLGDNTDEGPASEFAVFDRTRAPTPGSGFPGGVFALELFSYSYGELSTQPLTVSIYPVNVTTSTAYDPGAGLADAQRLKALGLSRARSFNVTVNVLNPEGEKGIKIGEVRFPGPTLLPAGP